MAKRTLNLKNKIPLDYYPWDIMLRQGFHWMDRYGNAYWIEEMSTDYLQRALSVAKRGCRQVANLWWMFALGLNGEMAQDQAERTAMRYDEYDTPLVYGLEKELAKRQGLPVVDVEDDYYLSQDLLGAYLENAGYAHMAAVLAIEEVGWIRG